MLDKEIGRVSAAVLVTLLVGACAEERVDAPSPPGEPAVAPATGEAKVTTAEVQRFPLRTALFGDLHVHTSWSTDAYSAGNRVPPEDAYRFARGEAVELPSGIVTQLQTPLDFVGISDHAEGFDAIGACTVADNPLYDAPVCQDMRGPRNNQADYLRRAFERGVARPAARMPGLCDEDESICVANARSTWERVQAVANTFDDPGTFSTLIGYEFSSLLPQFGMLHRNVFFRGSDVIPHAISSMDVAGQADFFEQLDRSCAAPCEVITIPHNTNYSWGLTLARTDEDGSAYTQEDMERRTRIDRLVEVTQMKGTSECQVGVGAADEDCDFGILFPICREGESGRCAEPQSFVRNALLDGIQLASEDRPNIFRFGMIGSTDTHNSDPGNTNAREPSRNAVAMGNRQAVQQAFDAVHPVVGPLRLTSVGGLAGVWAESNTRADIFDALTRRETFATTGSRLRVRFFGGSLSAEPASGAEWVAAAYRDGVPMGGELNGLEAPAFWVWAARDPNGPTLDRVQVVKGWIESGEARQRIWDVVCSTGRSPDSSGRCPKTSATVDAATCQRDDSSGAAQLQARFTDPGFRPDQHAFYYVRVFENPSCRWSTYLANSAGVEVPDDLPVAVQHRGWSSPIWVRP